MPKLVLSTAELEQVKILYARGLDYMEIAQKLQASPTTVRYYIAGYGKLKLKNTAWNAESERLIEKKFVRHPTVYTNIKSPFGISDELHSDKRIIL